MKKTITFLLLISSLIFGQNAGDIIITEFMANPNILSDANGEYIEFYNTTSSSIDINRWIILDDGDDYHQINNNNPLIIMPNDFLVLARTSEPGFIVDYDFESFVLDNTTDEIILKSGTTEITRLNYSDGDPFGPGISLELNDIKNHVSGLIDESNFKAATLSYNGDFGSPGSFGGTLPVELTTFSASVIDKNVKLNWETATEVNNYGFDIERKTEFGNWNKIAFIQGNGNSNSPKHYSYSDKSLFESGKYFYRLKQIDIDGKSEYSEVVEIYFASPEKFELLQNYPNPFNPVTKIKYSFPDNAGIEQKVVLKIYNVLGQVVKTLVNENKQPGNYEIEFNGSDLMSGIYFYKLEVGNFSQMRKMVLTK